MDAARLPISHEQCRDRLEANTQALIEDRIGLAEWHETVLRILAERYPDDRLLQWRQSGAIFDKRPDLRTSTPTGTRPLAAA